MVDHSAAGSDRKPDAALDRTLGALADPTRRAIVAGLRRGPATVSEVARPFPISLYGVSKHVRVLERAGLVHREVRGREHHLSLRAEPLRALSDWLDGYAAFWEERLDALERELAEDRRGD
ncbi:MAG: metalloregulator ArsR/SmtB family transcription factor [Myxococcota bacterium]|nr:metalloregulator ArsR/SmtB family transcription factor [Myxococcota bacterium]